MNCTIHGLTSFNRQKNGNAPPSYRCAKCASEAVARNVERKREMAYSLYGSSCSICGYDKCRNALEWHHTDPDEKEITPSKAFSRSWDRIKLELDKCVLLCANCHREVHAGLTSV